MEFRNDPLYKLAKGESVITEENQWIKAAKIKVDKEIKDGLRKTKDGLDLSNKEDRQKYLMQVAKELSNNPELASKVKKDSIRQNAEDKAKDSKEQARASEEQAQKDAKAKEQAQDDLNDKYRDNDGEEVNQEELEKDQAKVKDLEDKAKASEDAALVDKARAGQAEKEKQDTYQQLKNYDPDADVEVEPDQVDPTDDKSTGDKPAEDPKPQSNAQAGSIESVIQQISNLKNYEGFEKIVNKLMDEMKVCVSKYELGSEEPAQDNTQNPPTDNAQPTQE